ncbi:MAG TPA: circularly permuted type 2 ATP-grasp protein [Jatrophihabitans sp.]|nr:circularly permuted type 2 ATP-grasp protein [Jatrophihabitans sp.]
MTSTIALIDALQQSGYANLLDQSYSSLLDRDQVWADNDYFTRELLARDIRHEQKAVPSDARPLLIGQPAYDRITDAFGRLFPLLERAIELYLSDRSVRTFFNFAPRHDSLIRLGAEYRPYIQACRYDFTLDATGRPLIYELNTQCPAAATYAVHYAELAGRSRIQAALDGFGLARRPMPLEQPNSFAAAMLASAARNGRTVRGVAVLNSRYLTMNTELDHIVAQFRALGVPAVRCFVEDLRFLDGELRYRGLPIDLTYNKFDDSWGPDAYECAFSRTTAEVADYLAAYRAGAVLAVNSFPSMYLPEQKSMLAFLHSEQFAGCCTEAERALVAEIVPHTTVVRLAGPATLDRIAEQRTDYVLKKSLDTRGRNTVLGRSVSDATWRQTLAEALATEPGDDWVAQRLAPPLESKLDRLDGGEPETVFSTLACFLFTGSPVGLIVRSSVEETTNVGRVGFVQVPGVVQP